MSESKPLEKAGKKPGSRNFRRGKKPSEKPKNGHDDGSKENMKGSNDTKDLNQTKYDNSNKTDIKKKRKKKRNRGKHFTKGGDDSITGHKLVLRLLPPNLNEEQFWNTVDPIVGKLEDYQIESSYFVQGHYTLKTFHDPTYSRAYLLFKQLDKLKEFATKIHSIRFVDDKDSSSAATIRISPYWKGNTVVPTKSNNKKNIEGTIEHDALFKVFTQSLKLMEEDKDTYNYSEISLFKSLKKELNIQKEHSDTIQRKTEQALIELAGSDNSEKRKKKKAKNVKKSKKGKIVCESSATVTSNSGEEKKKKKSKKKKKNTELNRDGSPLKVEKNNNIVILEAAGKKELQRRKKSQKKKELENKLPSLIPVPSGATSTAISSKLKLLKRPDN